MDARAEARVVARWRILMSLEAVGLCLWSKVCCESRSRVEQRREGFDVVVCFMDLVRANGSLWCCGVR